jgi:hypothetical protein
VAADQVLGDLKKKSSLVRWSTGDRKEKYLVFAKSFKEKKVLEENMLLLDLADIEKLFDDSAPKNQPS